MAGHCYLSDGIYRYCLPALFECLGFADACKCEFKVFDCLEREWLVLVSKLAVVDKIAQMA